MNKSNCLICKDELIYFNESKLMNCYFCGDTYESGVMCKSGHYICDNCHSADAFEAIKNYCISSSSTNPIEMIVDLMKHPSIKIHGPEHHFLVPAVLSTAYTNKLKQYDKREMYLIEGEKRSKNVLGGFCGFYGACGAAVGTGIFMSLVLNTSPLSKDSWGLCNLITSKSLEKISNYGGPRCCKRDTFTAIETAIEFLKEHMNVELDSVKNLKCEYSDYNKECLKTKCKFYLV